MTVTLNEAALHALLDSEQGPVARFVEGVAEHVVEGAQKRIRDYFQTSPSLVVDQDVGLIMDGASATVGIPDAGNKARRLARMQAEGTFTWLSDALEEVRGR